MKVKGIPELPRINVPSLNGHSQTKQTQFHDFSHIQPNSARNSYQTPNWNKAQYQHSSHFDDQMFSHRQQGNGFEDDPNTYKNNMNSNNQANYSPDDIQSIRSSSVILDHQNQQGKQKYYHQGQIIANDHPKRNDFHSQTFRPSLTPQSQSFASNQPDKYLQDRESRTYFYNNKAPIMKRASQSNEQVFMDQQSNNEAYSEQNESFMFHQNGNDNFQINVRQPDSSRDSKRNSDYVMPSIDQGHATTALNDRKTYFPRTSENYKFFLNSALKDIHGIYQQNNATQQVKNEKPRYGSTSKASTPKQENGLEYRRRLNSISSSQQRNGSQDTNNFHLQQQQQHQYHQQQPRNLYSQELNGIKQRNQYTQQLETSQSTTGKKRRDSLALKNSNHIEAPNLNFVSYSTKNSNHKQILYKTNYNNSLRENNNKEEENIQYYGKTNNVRASSDLEQTIKQTQNYNPDFFLEKINLNETNKNHIRKNFHSKRIEELSKPKYPNLKQSFPTEKTHASGKRSKKQSPIRASPEKVNNINSQQTQNTDNQQRKKTSPAKDNKVVVNPNNNNSATMKVKENTSLVKSENKDKDKNTKASTLNNNNETQGVMIDSSILAFDSANEDNENILDESFEKLQQTVRQQNEVQEKLSQNNHVNRLTSIDKIRILIGKGKFHFSKRVDQTRVISSEQNDLNQTKDFITRQRYAQVKNDKIERILSLKNNSPSKYLFDTTGFQGKHFLKNAENPNEIQIFNSTVGGDSQYTTNSSYLQNFNKIKGLSKYNSEVSFNKRKVEFNVNFGFKLDKEIEFHRKQKEQKETKEREEVQFKFKQQKEQNCEQNYERERHRNLEVDIIIHSEEIQTKLVFGEKVSFIKIPVIQNAEELDIQYISKLDQYTTLCISQKQMQGAQFILRKEKLTDLKQQHYLFHVNSLMAKENNLYIKDPVAIRVDSEYYLLQFFKVYRKLKDILLYQHSSTQQSKPSFNNQQFYNNNNNSSHIHYGQQNGNSQYTNDDYPVTNQENDEEEERDSPFFNESQIINIFKQILENVISMNGLLNIFHANLNLDNIGLFEGNLISIINYDDTQIIYNKHNDKIQQRNYIISENNLKRVQYQKYVKYEEIPAQEFSPLEYQLHDIICLFIQLKFANPDIMSENQFKQGIKIINLEQPISSSGSVIKQLISYQQLQQHNLLDSFAKTLYIDKHSFGMDSLVTSRTDKHFNQIDQILFYLTTMQLQRGSALINSLPQEYYIDSLILKSLSQYLSRQYELSYEHYMQYENQYSLNSKQENNQQQSQQQQQQQQNDKTQSNMSFVQNNSNSMNTQIQQSVYFWKGRIEFMCKMFDKSIQSFEKYISPQENKCSRLLDLADFYKHIVNLNKSIQYYEQAEKYVISNKNLNLYQVNYVQIMKRQIYFHQNTDNKEKQIDAINRCIQFLTQNYKDDYDCELYSFKQQFSHLLQQQSSSSSQPISNQKKQ